MRFERLPVGGQRIAELGVEAVASQMQPPVEHQAGADAGRHGDEEEFAATPTGTEAELAPSCRACVVEHADRPREPLGQGSRQRERMPAADERRGVGSDAAVDDSPGDRHAERRVDISERRQQTEHRREHRLGALLGRRRHGIAPDDLRVVEQRRPAVGATDIERDHLSHPNPSIVMVDWSAAGCGMAMQRFTRVAGISISV